jgi:hypothetical protein
LEVVEVDNNGLVDDLTRWHRVRSSTSPLLYPISFFYLCRIRTPSILETNSEMKIISCSLFLFLFCTTTFFAQNEKIIFLTNPSFEGMPQPGSVPEGWIDCGFPNESPADIQPNPNFGVEKKASHGNTYLGMVVRDNDTWESVGQYLHHPLKVGEEYVVQLMLARSDVYYSFSRKSTNLNTQVNYVTPTILRIWGGRQECAKEELLAISRPITHQEWKNYQFKLSPQEFDHTFISFEVYYSGQYPLIGNLLLDDVTNIVLESSAKKLLSTFKEEYDNFTLPPEAEKFYTKKETDLTSVSIVPKVPSPLPKEEPAEPEPVAGEDQLKTPEDLQWVIKDNGQKISFTKGKLDKGFYSYYGRTYFQNVYLHNIVSALKIMPEYRISIAVHGKSKGDIKKKTKHLQRGFEELGLSTRNYRFVDWPDVVRAKDWVWPANINDLLIGLEKI